MENSKNYTVYFEIGGKKMKTKVLANSTTDAQTKVKDKIIFHKTVLDKNDYFNKSVDTLNDIMDVLGGKKKL